MYIRILFLSFLSILSLCPALAQKTIKDVLTSVPETVVPYLNSGQWAEISKTIDVHDSLTVKNLLNGATRVDSLSDSYVRVALTKISDLQIKLLPSKDSMQVICVIKTVKKPVPTSEIKFYSTSWSTLASSFGLPDGKDADELLSMFTQCPDTMDIAVYDSLCWLIEPIIVSAEFGNDNTLTYTLSLPMLSKEEKLKIQAILRQKSFKWNGKTFNKG